jgi:SPP1 family predicted phage head-tail adaptor
VADVLAPRLRHRITFLYQVQTQDLTSGAINIAWATWLADEPAEVVPLSGREFIQSAATQAQVSARMTIREREGIHPSMRITFDGETYEIAAILRDASARRWITLMVWKI